MSRFKHNLSHYHLTTGNFGELIPIQWTEILPKDTVRFTSSVFARCTPLLAPVMHPCQIRVHHFFVPNRILDENWEDFITGADPDAVLPKRVVGTSPKLDSWLGLPTQAVGKEVLAYPHLAYWRIWFDYYRDQELYPDTLPGPTGEVKVKYEKDYITTARPDPSRNPSGQQITVSGTSPDLFVDPLDVRQALAKQRFDEARSRYGNRYVEYLMYLGVKPSDARLQRAEFLGGGSSSLNFSEVLSTVETDTEPQGRLTGHGVSGVRTSPRTKFFEEHGIFMTCLSVRPKAIYTSGIKREWFKETKDDYWQKENQFVGQEPVFTREVYADNTVADDTIFGYQDKDYQYRRGVSHVSGEFRNAYDYWHLARQFSGHPGLTDGFITVEPNFNKRIFADQTNDGFLFATNHRIVARRLVTNNPSPRVL